MPVAPCTNLLGIYMAVHAIPDVVNLTHVPVGCKPKIMNSMVAHNGFDKNFYRNRWTGMSEADIIGGEELRLEQFIQECYNRYQRPPLMVVTTNTVIELGVQDTAAVVRSAQDNVGAKLVHVKAEDFGGDLYAGYADVVRAVLTNLDWSAQAPEKGAVNIIGYVYDRIEPDHAANVAELERILTSLSLVANSVFLSNRPYEHLERAPRAAANIVLPHLHEKCMDLEAVSHRPSVLTTLPLGLAPTCRWMREVARVAGVDEEVVEEVTGAEMERIEPLLRYAREHLTWRDLAVFSDTITAAHLCILAMEVGMRPTVVGLLDRTLGGKARLTSILDSYGLSLPERTVIFEDPTVQELARFERAQGEFPPFDVIIRPTFEFFAGSPGVIETGFVSYHSHTLFPMPTLGFNGVLALCQRLLSASLQPRVERRRRPPHPEGHTGR